MNQHAVAPESAIQEPRVQECAQRSCQRKARVGAGDSGLVPRHDDSDVHEHVGNQRDDANLDRRFRILARENTPVPSTLTSVKPSSPKEYAIRLMVAIATSSAVNRPP